MEADAVGWSAVLILAVLLVFLSIAAFCCLMKIQYANESLCGNSKEQPHHAVQQLVNEAPLTSAPSPPPPHFSSPLQESPPQHHHTTVYRIMYTSHDVAPEPVPHHHATVYHDMRSNQEVPPIKEEPDLLPQPWSKRDHGEAGAHMLLQPGAATPYSMAADGELGHRDRPFDGQGHHGQHSSYEGRGSQKQSYGQTAPLHDAQQRRFGSRRLDYGSHSGFLGHQQGAYR